MHRSLEARSHGRRCLDDISSGAQFAVLDGRTFIFLPYDEWAHTKIYELEGDGRAIERADTVGDVFKWIRVR